MVVVSVRSRHHHFGQASCNIHLCSGCHLGLVLGHHEGVKLRKDAGIWQLGGCALPLRIHALPVEESCQCNVRSQLVGVSLTQPLGLILSAPRFVVIAHPSYVT